jgi:hypothetical protein
MASDGALFYKHQVTVGNLPPDWLKNIHVTNQTCRSRGHYLIENRQGFTILA